MVFIDSFLYFGLDLSLDIHNLHFITENHAEQLIALRQTDSLQKLLLLFKIQRDIIANIVYQPGKILCLHNLDRQILAHFGIYPGILPINLL